MQRRKVRKFLKPIAFLVTYGIVNIEKESYKKSVFPVTFGRDRFQGNEFSFENETELQIINLTLRIDQTSF